MIVVIEGIDGSGKTTIAKKLSEMLLAEYVNTSPTCFIKKIFNMKFMPIILRFAFYLSYVNIISFKCKNKNKIFIFDRWIYSTFAHHYARGMKSLEYADPQKYVCCKADQIYYLNIDENNRISRLLSREINNISDFNAVEMRVARSYFYKHLNKNMINVDYLSVNELVNLIAKKIRNEYSI